MKHLTWSFLALMLAGCATSPEPDYYTLHAVDGATAPGYAATIRIERPTIPGYLDRPEMVRQGSKDSITIDDSNRWAEPLDTMMERVLAEDLRQRLPASTITSDADNSDLKSCFSVNSTIEQMNETAEGYSLKATITLVNSCAQPATRQFPVRINQKSGTAATAMSQLIGLYADQLAQQLQKKQ